jgi:hypothetical protein
MTASEIVAARAELAALPVPPGAAAAAFAELRRACDDLLAARLSGKSVQQLPDQAKNTVADAQVVSDGAGGFNLTWSYRNVGDYGQNGEVGVADLTPLGSNLGKTASSGDWAQAQVADGDGNGAITISDLTPIGANLGAQVSGYYIYGGPSETGPWALLGNVPLASAGGTPKSFTFPLGAAPAAFVLLSPFDSSGDDWLPGGVYALPGNVTLDASATIGAAGGTLDGPGGSPIAGVHVAVPAGALGGDVQLSLGHTDGTVTPLAGTWGGVMLDISATEPLALAQVMEVTMPFSGAADEVPVPYYVAPDGALQPCTLTAIDRVAGTFSFITQHASVYTYILAKFGSLPATYQTTFLPEAYGFQINHNGSLYYKAESLGMAAWSQWYYREQRSAPDFYPRFMQPLGDFGNLTGKT